eukprot:SAG11_NODE_9461_length_909_cov_4.501235_1_plen_66_part_00
MVRCLPPVDWPALAKIEHGTNYKFSTILESNLKIIIGSKLIYTVLILILYCTVNSININININIK